MHQVGEVNNWDKMAGLVELIWEEVMEEVEVEVEVEEDGTAVEILGVMTIQAGRIRVITSEATTGKIRTKARISRVAIITQAAQEMQAGEVQIMEATSTAMITTEAEIMLARLATGITTPNMMEDIEIGTGILETGTMSSGITIPTITPTTSPTTRQMMTPIPIRTTLTQWPIYPAHGMIMTIKTTMEMIIAPIITIMAGISLPLLQAGLLIMEMLTISKHGEETTRTPTIMILVAGTNPVETTRIITPTRTIRPTEARTRITTATTITPTTPPAINKTTTTPPATNPATRQAIKIMQPGTQQPKQPWVAAVGITAAQDLLMEVADGIVMEITRVIGPGTIMGTGMGMGIAMITPGVPQKSKLHGRTRVWLPRLVIGTPEAEAAAAAVVEVEQISGVRTGLAVRKRRRRICESASLWLLEGRKESMA
jgi:hypothetical protein